MKRTLLFGAIVGLIITASVVVAQSGGGYDLTWNTIDNGGGSSSGGAYTIAGTIGQFDTGVMSGGGYTLNGGFWAAPSQFNVYLPLIRK